MPKNCVHPIYQFITSTPLGDMRLACTENNLIGTWFVHEQRHAPASEAWITDTQHPILQTTAQQIAEYFDRQRAVFDLPLSSAWGTLFQKTVWQALRKIPMGQTSSYGDVAAQIGHPTAMRAVGAAIGKNPWSIIVPCHRVVGADGKLTGYAGGLHRKQALLELETST